MYPDEANEFGEPESPRPEPKPKPSMAPSWVMLGFIVGAGFIWALPNRRAAPVEPELRAAPPPPSRTVPQLTTIEAVFAEWGQYAVWDRDLTQVALWSSEAKEYSDCYEVFRGGGSYFFRSIPRLTRPVLTHGVRPDNSPLQFTETEAQRAEWLSEKHQETWRAISSAARENLGPATAPPPAQTPRQP
jgi:hypothetical protein